MEQTLTAGERIIEEVSSWPGVEAVHGSRGELSLRLGRREIGHLHGDHAAHFSFPKDVWAELREQGRIVPHPVFPDRAGPAARRIENDGDLRDVIELMRLNYDRAVERHGLPDADAASDRDSPPGAADAIIAEVGSWPGVETGPGRFGSVRFTVGRRELGHLHGDHLADLPFTRAQRDQLIAAGRVVQHRPLPDSGWASRPIHTGEDVDAVIELLRMQYDRARERSAEG